MCRQPLSPEFYQRLLRLLLWGGALLAAGCSATPPVITLPPEEEPSAGGGEVPGAVLALEAPPQVLSEGGVTLHIYPRPESGLVSVQLWLRAGSRDEPSSARGAAVAVQSLIIGHPEQPQTLAGEIAALGGEARGWTSIDRSVFELILLPEELARGLELLHKHLTTPDWSEGRVAVVLDGIDETQARARQWLGRRALERLLQRAYREHQNGRPVMPRPEELEQLTAEALRAFHQRYYRPDQAQLVILGEVESASAEALATSRFSAWRGEPAVPPADAPAIEIGQGFEVQVEAIESDRARILIACPLSPLTPEGSAYLDLLALLLVGDGDGLIYQGAQRLGLKLLHSRALPITPEGAGQLVLSLEVPAEQVELAWWVLAEQLSALRYRPPTQRALEQAKVLFERDARRSTETLPAQARRIGFFALRWQNTAGLTRYRQAIYQIQPQDIASFSELLFHPRQLVALVQSPVPGGGEPARWEERLRGQFEGVMRDEPLISTPGLHQLSPDLKVLYHPAPGSEVVSLQAYIPFNEPLSDARELALGHWVAELLMHPGPHEPSMRAQFNPRGLSLTTTVTRERIDDAIVSLMRRLRQAPIRGEELWSSEIVERARSAASATLERQLRDPIALVSRLFTAALLREHRARPAPLHEQRTRIEAMSTSDLLRWFERRLRVNPILLTVTGDLSARALSRALTPFSSLRRTSLLGSGPQQSEYTPLELPPAQRCRQLHQTTDHRYAQLLFGFPVSSDQLTTQGAALTMIKAALIHPRGLLKQGLAEAAPSASLQVWHDPLAPHPWLALSVLCAPVELPAAREALQQALSALQSAPLGESELPLLRSFVRSRQRIELASSARRTRWLMLRALEGKQDLSLAEVQRLLRAPEELSGEEVQSLAREIFAPAQKIEVLIAPPESAAGDCRPVNL